MHRFASGLILLTALLATARAGAAPLADWEVRLRYEGWQTVILVHVVESSFPPVIDSVDDDSILDASATVLVLKSWKGPFAAGRVLHVAPLGGCAGSSCVSYPLQAGDDLLIFDQRTEDPIHAVQPFVLRAEDSKAAMATLDQLVHDRPSSPGPNQRLERP
jgi:hypothetical protein